MNDLSQYEFKLALPGELLPEECLECRFLVLREPLDAPRGSEVLADDLDAIHAWFEDSETGEVVAVGRAHLIAPDSIGGGADYAEKGAPVVPGFVPLQASADGHIGDESQLRPAYQVRQMGTRPDCARLGLGTRVLEALEEEAVRLWRARSGWLQARTPAVDFYHANDWQSYGEEYDIESVGPHWSMWKPSRLAEQEQEVAEAAAQLVQGKAKRNLTKRALFRPHEGWDFFQRPEAEGALERSQGPEYDPVLAWLFAEASMLAYSREEDFIRAQWARIGIDRCEFFKGRGAEGHFAIGETGAVLVFRGTDPDDVEDLRTDLEIRLVGSPGGRGLVHCGFAEATVSVWPQLIKVIREIQPRPLWLTGHSLGGALALVAAESLSSVRSIYTYGQPRVGNADFRDQYPWKVHRVIHNNDIVPLLPPPIRYRHLGDTVFINDSGQVRTGTSVVERSQSRISGALEDLASLFDAWRAGRSDLLPDSRLSDHSPRNYAMPLLQILAKEDEGS